MGHMHFHCQTLNSIEEDGHAVLVHDFDGPAVLWEVFVYPWFQMGEMYSNDNF